VHKTHEEHPSSVRRHRKQLSRAATCSRIAANQERRRIVRRRYETRSSGYRSHTDVRSSAPSPQNLTGKRSLTYSVAPFVVELFVARVRPSPTWQPSPSRRGGHTPVPSVARRELPTPAALNELAVASPNPTDGICTRFACRNRGISAGKRSPSGFASPTRPRSTRGLSASPVFPVQRTTPLDRTPGLLRSGRFFLTA
jgi:hypothetical protein